MEHILKDQKEHVEIYKAIAGYHLVSMYPSVHLFSDMSHPDCPKHTVRDVDAYPFPGSQNRSS